MLDKSIALLQNYPVLTDEKLTSILQSDSILSIVINPTIFGRYLFRKIELSKIYPSLEEVEHSLNKEYNLTHRKINNELLEHAHTLCLVYFILSRKEIPEHIISYCTTEKYFIQRFYIRIRLITLGWKRETIEKTLETYYNLKITHTTCLRAVHELIRLMCEVDIPIKMDKGRPKMPKEIKQIGKSIMNKKTVKRGQKHTHIIKQIRKVLTPDIFGEITKYITDNKELENKVLQASELLHS